MTVPELMPTLARGKHRSPRRGACFMEMASFLAGERWSDHPACTHPLLASLARLVNDNTPDDERQRLVPLIPSVIGLRSNDPRWDAVIARRAAASALPIAAESRQRALAVGLLTCERVFGHLDGHPPGTVDPACRAALARVPLAWEWARRFAEGHDHLSMMMFRRHAAPSIVVTAVAGIAEACISDRPAALRSLLETVIDDCTALQPDSDRTTRGGPARPAGTPMLTSAQI